MRKILLTLLYSCISLLTLAQVTPQGSLSGNAICPGAQATLTFTATAGTGPFTVRYTDGNAIRTQTGVTSGTPFNAVVNTTATKTYTLLKVTGSDAGTRSSGFTDATGTVTVSPRPDLKNLTLAPIAPVCAGSDASLSLSGFVQTRSFQTKPPITTLTNGALSVYSADLDGDGDMDVLSASVTDDKVAWYKNDGSGGFGPQLIISTSADFPTSVHAADLDGDGDLDVLSASLYDDKIAWYQNNGSSGFGPQNVISNSADDANSVYAADLDGDGDLDVLSASINDSKIAWYENNGSGAFGPQTVISTAGSRAQSVYAADLDGDGDMDVLSASSNDDKIAWYQNNGSGGFGAQSTISTAANGAAFVTAADLDGDGDMDVLSASQEDNKVAWYRNNGSGGFGAQNIISTSAGGTASVYAADLDGDGDLDVLSASGQDNKVAWYENNGSGGFGAQIVISNTTGFAYSVYAADLDGDGDLDVPVAAYHGDRIEWFENRTPFSGNATVTYTAGGGVPKTVTVPVSAGSATVTLTAPKAGTVTLLKISNGGPCATSTGKSTHLRHLPRPDLKDLTLAPIAPVCAGSDATLSLSGFVQTRSFQTKSPITTLTNGAYSVYSADLDGDGDLDVLSASGDDAKIAWYKNDGSGGFTAQTAISTSGDGAHSVYAADLDGDEDLDVLSASGDDNKIAWYKNDGSGGFTEQTAISTTADDARSVYAADLDGDGDLDVLSASGDDNKIAWYKNDGSGGFTAQTAISTTADDARSVYAADLDGDGDMDVLSASINDDKIAWYKNDGSGGFTTETLISNLADGAYSVYAADLDNDGDMDVLSASVTDGKIAWYKNDGSGGFIAQTAISTSANGAVSVHAADLDGDGDLDVLSACTFGAKIAWYKNDGSGGFTEQTDISTSAFGARSVYAADLDGDGDLDVLSASNLERKIAWYENRTPFSGNATVTYTAGGGVPKTVTVPVSAGSTSLTLTAPKAGLLTLLKISNGDPCATSTGKSIHLRHLPRPDLKGLTLAPIAPVCAGSDATLPLSGFVQSRSFQTKPSINTSVDFANSVYAADLDGDGDIDVLSASVGDNKIAWYKNNGSGTFTTQSSISTSADGAASVYAADLDGDGDLDVLSASLDDNKIAWYKNDGNGNFTAQTAISTLANGARSVYAADLDGDGDLDVLSASVVDDKIAWYKNDGSGGFGTQQVITIAGNYSQSVYAADLDGDGDLDVLSASSADNKIAWYKNDGSGGFGAQQLISTVNGAVSVYAADLDGDGDMDVLSASFGDDKIAWYKNNGSGTFTAQPSITTSADGAYSVYAADLDGDGDIDVLSASVDDDKIVWYQNDGSGTFTTQSSISTSANSARSVYAADLDGDGDMDVLSASANDDKIAWYENRTPFSGNAQVSYTINGGSTQTAPITVSSGSASAVIVSPVSGTLQLSKISALGGCETAVSSSTSLSVNPVSVGGTVSAPQTLCTGTGTSPADLTLSGQVGNVVRWEKSANSAFSSPTPISSTSATLTSALIGNLTADTYFRAVVKSGVCNEAASNSVLITVNAQPVGPSLNVKTPNVAAICFGTAVSAVFNPGSGGAGCSDDFVVIIDGGSPVAYTSGSLVGATANSSIVIQGRRANCISGSGCNGTSYVTLASWSVSPQPVGPSLNVKAPNVATVCFGTSVSAAFNTGSGGVGCSDDFVVIIDGGSPVAYTSGALVGATATASIVIQGRRANCTSGSGCNGTAYATLASWTVSPQPVGPSLNTKTPNVAAICKGTNVSASFNAGSGGVGCSDDYVLIIDGGSPVAYTSGALVGATASSSIVIQGRRANCASGSGCNGTAYITLASWIVKPVPSSQLTASKYDVCPNTEVSLDAHCSIPTATINWNPGAPTVTPNAATLPYIYKASCTADGCTGNESSVEVRTHRILVDMKDLDVGTLPLPIARAVKDNLAPANLIQAPAFPRRWTFIANGCDAAESAVFKLSGPVNFQAIDNQATYAMFGNDAAGFYSLDHPNYGNGGSFPNGTYTLTVDLRSADGVGGPFPKNRLAAGTLLATRTLQFTVSNPTARSAAEGTWENPITDTDWVSIGQNPVSRQLAVHVTGQVGEEVDVVLMNLQGQALHVRTRRLASSQQSELIPMEHLPAGLYLLKALKANKVKTFRVIKVD